VPQTLPPSGVGFALGTLQPSHELGHIYVVFECLAAINEYYRDFCTELGMEGLVYVNINFA
jgi:hypothetical protein